ncbi:hypothetical protein NHG29_01910 [Aerococcaceae bacterium NML160702]|nr:hypothetical protein [Aerococcaceae bacterium NML160702]
MSEAMWIAVITVIGGGLLKVGGGKILEIAMNIKKDFELIKEELMAIKTIALENRGGIRNTQRYRLQYDMQKALILGYTTTQQLNEVSILYESYHVLGGNGAIEALYQKFIELPIKEEN